MNNHPYDSQYAANQRRQDYYGPQGQPPTIPQGYESYPQHGVQTFQNHSYLLPPQQPQPAYSREQEYLCAQPPHQPAHGYQYNTTMPQQMTYRAANPQVVISPRMSQYDRIPSMNASRDHHSQGHQNVQRLGHAQAQTQAQAQIQTQVQPQVQQQSYMTAHQQPQTSRQMPSPQTYARSSPQLQHHPQQRPPQVQQQVPSPRTQPKTPRDQQPPGPPIQRTQSQQQAMPSPQQPSQQPPKQPSKQSSKQSSHQPSAPPPKQKPHLQNAAPRAPKTLQPQKAPTSVKSHHQSSQSHANPASTTPDHNRSQAESTPSEGLFIALAEEYLAVAAQLKQESGEKHPTPEYFELLTAGLRSLKVVLVDFRPQPAVEAAVRLRYASILLEETEQYIEIEETLSNGITMCERSRLLESKYHMMHILVRCLFKTKPKAALRYLDSGLRDVESTRHTVWLYAFRLLRATLSMQTGQQQEVVNAMAQLRLLSEKARQKGDRLVSALAGVMEAHIALSRNNTAESIEQAQRALATPRSLQQTPYAKEVPQIIIMTGYIDVVCSLYQADMRQASAKMQAVRADMDELIESPRWSSDGSFHISVNDSDRKDSSISNPQSTAPKDSPRLSVSWLDKEQTYGLGYMLYAITRHYKNAADERNESQKLLAEAQAMFEASDDREPSEKNTYARQALHALLLVSKIFEQCSRNRWADAKTLLGQFFTMVETIPEVPGAPWQALAHYLDGVTQQATGNMDTALKAYYHDSLALPRNNEFRAPYQRELAVLATMNSLLIIRTPGHPLHNTYAATLSALEPHAKASPSQNVFSAYNLVRAAMPDLQATTSILESKGFVQTALGAAKQACNNQLVMVTLNILSYKFFRGVVGEQAEKSGRATQTLARKGKDSLWLSVADGALAETLEAHGKVEEAQVAMKEAIALLVRLPKNISRVAEDNDKLKEEHDEASGQIGLTDQFA